MQSAAKVGFLVIVFVALLFGAYAALGRTVFAAKTDTYYATFDDATGLVPTTPVLMAGVKIGNVTKVELAGPHTAKVTFAVDEQTKIPERSTAIIATPLIGLGDTPMSIEPPAMVTAMLPVGSTLAGTKAGALENILPNSKETVAELNKTLVAVRGLLEDPKMRNRVDNLLATTDHTVKTLDELMQTANSTLLKNQVAISQAIQSANLAMHDVQRVTTQVASLIEDPKVKGNLKGILADVNHITTKTDKLMTSVNNLVSDPKLRKSLTDTAANVADITATGKEIAENTRQITEQGIEISRNAKTITEKAIPLVDNTNEVMKKAADLEDQLSGTIDRVGGFFTRKPGPGPLANVGLTMDLMRETNPGYWRTDIGFSVPIAYGTLHAGLYDAFGSNKLIAQIGKQATPNLQYRYGIYAAKPGVGVDYRLAPKVTLRGDVWDINRLRVDLRARYDFGNGIVGWVGVDSLFDRNAPTIGIGLRR